VRADASNSLVAVLARAAVAVIVADALSRHCAPAGTAALAVPTLGVDVATLAHALGVWGVATHVAGAARALRGFRTARAISAPRRALVTPNADDHAPIAILIGLALVIGLAHRARGIAVGDDPRVDSFSASLARALSAHAVVGTA